MALVGACFCIAFTFGPALGAWLSTTSFLAANPFATAAGFSLFLIVVETIYLYFCLPETLPSMTTLSTNGTTASKQNGKVTTNGHANGSTTKAKNSSSKAALTRTNSHTILNLTHFTFILFFSGMEFSLPFMTFDLFSYTAPLNGRLLGYIGLIASLLQGGLTRRLPPLLAVKLGTLSCLFSLFLLSRITTQAGLYAAVTLLAITTATVVTGLNALSSFEAGEGERGGKLGNLRSWGQVGRAAGPVLFCSLYWWAGRETAYLVGTTGMVGVVGLVWGGLKTPRGTEGLKMKDLKEVEVDL